MGWERILALSPPKHTSRTLPPRIYDPVKRNESAHSACFSRQARHKDDAKSDGRIGGQVHPPQQKGSEVNE